MAANFFDRPHDSRRRVHQAQCHEAVHGHVPRRHPARRHPRRRRAEFREAQPVLVVEVAAGEARHRRTLEKGHRGHIAGRHHRPDAQQVHGRASHDGARRRDDAHFLRHPVHHYRELQQAPSSSHHGPAEPRLQDGANHRILPGVRARRSSAACCSARAAMSRRSSRSSSLSRSCSARASSRW